MKVMNARGRVRMAALLAVSLLAMAPASAQETVTYTYDALGRVVAVNHGSTGPNANVSSSYTYDKADNRTNVTVTGNSVPPAPTFAIGNAAALEGSALNFTVTRSGSTAGTDTVQYSTVDGTATAGSDYTAISPAQTLTFSPGVATQSVSVNSLTDNLVEGNETFLVNLSNPSAGATITTGQGTGTINDGAPSFSINDATASEGGSVAFTVTRSGSSSGTYTVQYATADGTATAGSDYTAVSPPQTLTFGDGVTSQQVNVAALSDAVSESSETFYVNLTSPSAGSSISDGQGVGTITDPTTFSISDASATEGSQLTFTVTISGPHPQTITVDYATADGTASSAGKDYSAKSGRLTFHPTDTSQTLNVPSNQDRTVEGDEYFYVNLSSPSGGAIIVDGQGVGTIVDDD